MRTSNRQVIAVVAASLVGATPVMAGPMARASALTVPSGGGPTVAGACPTTTTGGIPAVEGLTHPLTRVDGPAGAYYGNPKVGVQIAAAAPGLCPSFPDSTPLATDQLPDLAGFVLRSEPDPMTAGDPTPTCVTGPATLSEIVPDSDGACQMDPAGTKAFPMSTVQETFGFTVVSSPLGWAPDPDFGTPQQFDATIYACTDVGDTDVCGTTSEPFIVSAFDNAADVFNYIGIFRHVKVDVVSALTGKAMAGVTVRLACAIPAGQPSDVCPAASATAVSDADGVATFAGLYAPGAPLTLTESGLPAPYRSVTTTASAPSPVTAHTTTGAEISAATEVPAVLTVAPTAPLATVDGRLYEDKTLQMTSVGDATAGIPSLTVTSVGRPQHGQAVLRNGQITYTPDHRYVGHDTFTYRAGVGTAPGGTGTIELTISATPAAKSDHTHWFRDPVSAAQRRAEIPVPTDPAGDIGPLQSTRATFRTHGGSFAVPLNWAYGHTLVAGEALSLTGQSLFAFNSAILTPVARAQLGKLAEALSHTRSLTCQGYSDFGGEVSHQQALSLERAQAVCALLRTDRHSLTTTSVGYGGDDPVIVGAGATTSALNRRVVIVITRSKPR